MKLNLFGPVTEATGYGVFVINLAKELGKICDLTLTPYSRTTYPGLERYIEKGANFYYDAPSVNIWHASSMQSFCGDTRIGFPIFEATKFSKSELWHLDSLDRIFVTSKWAADIVVKETQISHSYIDVIGGGIDPAVFHPSQGIDRVPNKVKYVSSSLPRPWALNIGKLEYRKGYNEIISAFLNYPGSLSIICLWHNHFAKNWLDIANSKLNISRCSCITLPGNAGILWKKDKKSLLLLPWEEKNTLIDLMKSCDYGLFPYRSEGWCLPLHEMMACGKPVIATNYSAPTEYLNENCGVLLEGDGMESMYEPMFFSDHDYGEWRKPSVDEIIDAMQRMENEDMREKWGRNSAISALNHTWEIQAKKILEAINGML